MSVGGIGGRGFGIEDAVASPPAAAPRERPSLLDRAKDEVVEIAWKEVTRERRIDLASVPLGDRGALGLRALEKIIPPSDPIVTGDAHRAAYSASNPHRHTWLRTGGIIDGRLGLNVPIAAGTSLGFSTNAALEYSVLAPYRLNASGALDVAGNLTWKLPVTAENALALARGAEVSVRGIGTVGASATAGAGASYGAEPLSLALSAGVRGSVSAQGEITLNVKRLDGNKVYVRIGQATAQNAETSIGLHAGVRGVRDAIPPIDLPAGAVGDYVEGRAPALIAREIEKRLQAQAGASAGASRGSREVAAYVLDLGTPEGREAYEALVKLDTGPATRLATAGGAVRAALEETTSARTSGVNVGAGGAKLFLLDNLRREREATLTGADGVDTAIRTSTFRRQASGLFSDERDVTWEGVTYQRRGGERETYFHLSFKKRDGATRDDEVDEIRRFAASVDTSAAGRERLERNSGFFGRVLDGAYGDTTTKLDVYFTREGLRRISSASEGQVMAAFADAARELDGTERPPAWSVPGQAEAAERFYQRYRTAGAGGPRSHDPGVQQRVAMEYRNQFGRDIRDDMADLEAARLLARHVTSMRGKPEEEWAAVFADLGSQARFDLWKQTTALNKLAGTDQTLVHELSVKGDRVEIAVHDEGRLANVDDMIGSALAPP